MQGGFAYRAQGETTDKHLQEKPSKESKSLLSG